MVHACAEQPHSSGIAGIALHEGNIAEMGTGEAIWDEVKRVCSSGLTGLSSCAVGRPPGDFNSFPACAVSGQDPCGHLGGIPQCPVWQGLAFAVFLEAEWYGKAPSSHGVP